MIHARGLGVALAVVFVSALPARAQVSEYYHLDGIGNVRVVTDQAQAVVERHDLLPFGEEWCGTAVCAGDGQAGGQAKKFTGKERDTETDLDYFGARYYGSRIARFTTVDPVVDTRKSLVDPQRWNRYSYGRDNPVRFVDPDGREVAIAQDANQGFVRKALVEYARRSSGRAELTKLKQDPHRVVLHTGSLNSYASLTIADRLKKPIAIQFGNTQPQSWAANARVDVTIDDQVHRSQYTNPAGIDTDGVVTVGHEFSHVDDYLSGDRTAYDAGDHPTSATGPAMAKGRAINAEEKDVDKKEAEAFVNGIVGPKEKK